MATETSATRHSNKTADSSVGAQVSAAAVSQRDTRVLVPEDVPSGTSLMSRLGVAGYAIGLLVGARWARLNGDPVGWGLAAACIMGLGYLLWSARRSGVVQLRRLGGNIYGFDRPVPVDGWERVRVTHAEPTSGRGWARVWQVSVWPGGVVAEFETVMMARACAEALARMTGRSMEMTSGGSYEVRTAAELDRPFQVRTGISIPADALSHTLTRTPRHHPGLTAVVVALTVPFVATALRLWLLGAGATSSALLNATVVGVGLLFASVRLGWDFLNRTTYVISPQGITRKLRVLGITWSTQTFAARDVESVLEDGAHGALALGDRRFLRVDLGGGFAAADTVRHVSRMLVGR